MCKEIIPIVCVVFFNIKPFFKVKISTCFLVFDRNHMKVSKKKKLSGLDEKLLIFIVISKKYMNTIFHSQIRYQIRNYFLFVSPLENGVRRERLPLKMFFTLLCVFSINHIKKCLIRLHFSSK